MRKMKLRVMSILQRRLVSTHTSLVLAIALGSNCWFPGIGSAATLASETFESYATGALSGQGGGAVDGWGGNWGPSITNPRADVVDTTSNPLVYPIPGGATINGESNAMEVQLTGGATTALCARRQLLTPIAETFYVGYLVRYVGTGTWAGANNTFTLHLGTNATQSAVFNFGIRGNGDTTANEFVLRYGTGAPVTGASTGGQVVNGTDYFLVARMNYAGGLFTSANMWLNPSAIDDVDTPSGDASLTFTASFANPISHIFFREAVLEADDVLRADEIRIGTTWGDVVPVPEPGSVTLLSLGAAALWIFRRSHRRA